MATTSAPKSTGLKYTYRDGEGYREWYKANMGADWDGTYLNAKPEGMSDVDWMQGTMIQRTEAGKAAAAEQKAQTGQQLTDIYNQQTSAAQASFNSMANQYGQQMKGELEYAGVLHERMKRYLPQQMAAQGMGNMGIAQTAGANAVAKHMSNRGAIIGQHQASMNELSRNHGERQAALDTEYRKGMMAADAAYNDRVTQLDDQYFNDEMALFGQTVEEKAAEQEQYYLAGSSGIANATTREEALALAEQMKPYVSQAQYDRLVVEANNRGNELEGIEEEKQELDTNAAQDKAAGQLSSLFSAGTDAATLRTTLDGMIAAGTIPESDRAYWEAMIINKEKMEADEAQGKITTQQVQAAAEAETLLLQATTAEQRAKVLETYQGAVSESQYRYLESLVSIADGNQQKEDTTASQNKAIEQLSSLFAAGTSAAKLKETLDGMIAAGTIPESDRSYWETMIANKEAIEAEEAAGKITAEQTQAAAEAETLLLQATTPEQRAQVLATYKGAVSESQYRYLESLAGIADGNQSASDKQEGYDKADMDLRTLYNAGASSADLQSTYDALAAAGKIEPGREQFWKSMISLRQNEEKEIEQGKISVEQKENADFAMIILGEALDPNGRAEIMASLGQWLKSGKITQTQYDMAKEYCKVLDGNAEYLDKLDDESQAEQDHQISYENTLTYIAFAAADYDDAWRYAVERRDEFSDTEWESIEIQLAARKKADDEAKLANQSAEQAEAESRFVDQMSLYASSADATAKISALLESYKERLHPDVYNAWKMYLDELAKDPNQQLVEKQQEQTNEQTQKELDAINKGYGSAAEYDAAVLAGQEPVEYEGMEYLLSDKQINVSESAYKEIIESNLKSSGYEGIFDKSIKNGTTVTFAGLNKEDVCLTYYNGAWYASKLYRGSGGRGGNF